MSGLCIIDILVSILKFEDFKEQTMKDQIKWILGYPTALFLLIGIIVAFYAISFVTLIPQLLRRLKKMDKKMIKADLLWLWYDYQTESYNQSVPSIPNPIDSDTVIVIAEYMHWSQRYADKLMKKIYEIANLHSIPKVIVDNGKLSRLVVYKSYRLERYKQFLKENPHKFNFIEEHNKLSKQKGRKL